MNYSLEQEEQLRMINDIFSSLSICASVILVLCYFYFSNMRSLAFRLVFWVAISDIGDAVATLCIYPKTGEWCPLLSTITNFFDLCSLFWVFSIVAAINSIVSSSTPFNAKKYIWTCHMTIWPVAIIASILPLTTASYGLYGGKCWLEDGGAIDKLLRIEAYYGWLVLVYGYLVYVYVPLYLYLASDIGRRAAKSSNLIYYPLVLFLDHLAGFSRRMLEICGGEAPFWLALAHTGFDALRGFIHAVYYSGMVRFFCVDCFSGSGPSSDYVRVDSSGVPVQKMFVSVQNEQSVNVPEPTLLSSPVEEKIDDVELRGVSFSFFIKWARFYNSKYPDYRTRNLVDEIIIPATRDDPGPYWIKIPPEDRGRPHVFISHAWDMSLKDLIEAIEDWRTIYIRRCTFDCCCNTFRLCGDFCTNNLGCRICQNPILWIDILAIPQNKGDHTKKDIAKLDKTIASIGHVVLCTDVKYEPLKRSWCLFELANAKKFNAMVTVGLCSSFTSLDWLRPGEVAPKIDVENAETKNPEDKVMIDKLILKEFKSFEKLNEDVTGILVPRLEFSPALAALVQNS